MTECELFKTRVEHHLKPVSNHPWQRTIRSEYSQRIKHCHNSLRNPIYPEVKKSKPHADRVKFTVIGNRVTKEFIYCSNLVRGICTYRWKSHEPPVIRGLTSVEWIEALKDLKLKYEGLTYCLNGDVAVLYNDKILGGAEELKNLIETRYLYHVCVNYRKEALNQFASYIKASGRPCAYMHIDINENYAGTLIFMLYSDIVPRTCENFLRLCQTKRGGYSGTPVHRIVKDGWVQCGGYGLKSTNLNCENFAVPHDRRGVLCMANDGRDTDCSTQFFILLQPSPWMAHKYVAFGQLIDGDTTLRKIEEVPTWYESPKEKIIICRSGLLNLECQDIRINKSTFSYIQGHIENLVTVEELVWQLLMERVFSEIEYRRVLRMDELGEQEEDLDASADDASKRYIQRIYAEASENNDFDVDDYEPEEYSYVSLAPVSLPPKPEKLFYIPLTDVPYPGEVDSTYDLKKFLRGDCCLESDLAKLSRKDKYEHIKKVKSPVVSDIFNYTADDQDNDEGEDLDSDEELEIKEYLMENGEKVSFAGKLISRIAERACIDDKPFVGSACAVPSIEVKSKQSAMISVSSIKERARGRSTMFQESARIRVFKDDTRSKTSVLINVKETEDRQSHIKRRTTEFISKDAVPKMNFDSMTSGPNIGRAPSVMINVKETEDRRSHIKRRATEFVRNAGSEINPLQDEDDDDEYQGKLRMPRGSTGDRAYACRPSVMSRLYDDVKIDDDEPAPTLKDYKPLSEVGGKNPMFLTKSAFIRNDDELKTKGLRPSIVYEEGSYENVMSVRHGRKSLRKTSSSTVRTLNRGVPENSLRTLDFARTRPTLTVEEYQSRNQQRKQENSEG